MKLYFDIDTQIDFMYPAGALYVPGAEKLLPLIATLNRAALAGGGKVISTTCAHTEDDPEFKVWPPHCVVGTVGQNKPCALLLENRSNQIILEKSQLDLFSNPTADTLIRSLDPEECIVYGVVTEYCVKLCAMGLLDRGYKVSLVREATQFLSAADADEFLNDFASRSGAGFSRLS
jgi:nicotinamidase/pyrazinamidase